MERAVEHLERAGFTTLEQVEALSTGALEKALGDNLAYRVSEALPKIKVPSRYTHTHTHKTNTCTPYTANNIQALAHQLILTDAPRRNSKRRTARVRCVRVSLARCC